MPVQIERRTQQERRVEAERRLLAAAARRIGMQGARSTTLAQVGGDAGYSRGLVHHHFGSKAALIERLVTSVQEAFGAHVAPEIAGRHGLDAVLGVVDAYLRALEPIDESGRAFLVMWGEAAGSPELRPVIAAGDRRFRRHVSRAVAGGVEDGSINKSIDPDAFAAALVGQLRGVGLQVLIDRRGVDIGAVRAQIHGNVRKALIS